MTFYLHQGGVVMSSQITHTYTHLHTHTQSSNIHPLAHILDTAPRFSVVAPFLQFTPAACNGIPPSPGDNHQSIEDGPTEHRTRQKWPRETHSVTSAPGLSTLSYLSRIVAQPPPSFLCCPRPPSHHPSSLTSVFLVPGLHFR